MTTTPSAKREPSEKATQIARKYLEIFRPLAVDECALAIDSALSAARADAFEKCAVLASRHVTELSELGRLRREIRALAAKEGQP